MTPNLRAKGHQLFGEDGRRRLWRFHSGLPIVTHSNCTEPFALSKTKDFELKFKSIFFWIVANATWKVSTFNERIKFMFRILKNRLKTYPGGLHQNGHANKVRNLLEHQLNNRTTSHSRLKRLFKLSSTMFYPFNFDWNLCLVQTPDFFWWPHWPQWSQEVVQFSFRIIHCHRK